MRQLKHFIDASGISATLQPAGNYLVSYDGKTVEWDGVTPLEIRRHNGEKATLQRKKQA